MKILVSLTALLILLPLQVTFAETSISLSCQSSLNAAQKAALTCAADLKSCNTLEVCTEALAAMILSNLCVDVADTLYGVLALIPGCLDPEPTPTSSSTNLNEFKES